MHKRLVQNRKAFVPDVFAASVERRVCTELIESEEMFGSGINCVGRELR